MGAADKYTAWGTVVGTGAASIDIVLMEATRPLTVGEIEDEIRRRGLPERGAVSSHLSTLKRRGHVVNTPAGWCRVELAPGYAKAPVASPDPPAPLPSAPAPPAPASAPPPSSATATERLHRVKLVLEIGVVLVSLIGGIIALVWKVK